jgi:uncharacterized membrane protein YdbT with pleckstrin-like domain
MFPGQHPGERIVWRGRRSKWFLLATGWPIPVGLLILQGLWLARQAIGELAGPLLATGLLLLVLFTLWWGPTHVWGWIFQQYMLTSERAIKTVGGLRRRREEIELGQIVQVRVSQPSMLQMAFSMGDIELRTAGDPVLLTDVAHPRELADKIHAEMGAHIRKQAQDTLPRVANPQVQAAIEELARPRPLPAPELVHRAAPPGMAGRGIPVRLMDGESILEIVYRHWLLLVQQAPLPAVLLIGGVLVFLFLSAVGDTGWAVLMLLAGIGGGAIVGLLIYLNWANDIFVLTTHRVIDIDRFLFVLAATTTDAAYDKVQNARVQQGLIGKVFGFGSILVETAGRQHPLEMRDIPRAFEVMDRIFANVRVAQEREQVATDNREKRERYLWLSNVLSRMLVTVPDVRGLPLLDALAKARGVGLNLVVTGERAVPSGRAGYVLEQMPSPGTCALTAAELRVMLSAVAGGGRQAGQGVGGPGTHTGWPPAYPRP